MSALRRVNLAIVGTYGIHSSVFPSAHVSSVFAAAWGLLAILRHRRTAGWAMVAYGVVVSIATIYGRYHYAIDVLAGAAVSLLGWAAVRYAVADPDKASKH
jgi:membrane-associated phospholipid phosphatase